MNFLARSTYHQCTLHRWTVQFCPTGGLVNASSIPDLLEVVGFLPPDICPPMAGAVGGTSEGFQYDDASSGDEVGRACLGWPLGEADGWLLFGRYLPDLCFLLFSFFLSFHHFFIFFLGLRCSLVVWLGEQLVFVHKAAHLFLHDEGLQQHPCPWVV